MHIFSRLMLTLAAGLVAGCGSTYPLLTPTTTSSSEATALRLLCKQRNIDTPDVHRADSLLIQADSSQARSSQVDAYWLNQLAISHYKLALSTSDLSASEEKITELEKSLAAIKKQLADYRKVLTELERMKTP